MEHCSEPERTILECECGEYTILLGSEDDWRSRRAVVECEGCGRKITVDDRPDEKFLAVS